MERSNLNQCSVNAEIPTGIMTLYVTKSCRVCHWLLNAYNTLKYGGCHTLKFPKEEKLVRSFSN